MNRNTGNKQIIGGAILSYGAIAFNIIAGLLYTPWMIHSIGDNQYALYTLAISIINFFLLDFGIASAVSKFLSNYYSRKQYEEANVFMGIVYKVFIVISAAIAICLFVFYLLMDGIYVKLSDEELQTLKRLFVIVASYSVLTFPFISFNGVLMANERFIAVKACNFGHKLLTVVLIAIALLMGKGVYALVLINALSNVVFVIIKYLCIRETTCLKVKLCVWDRETARSLFGYSVWITVGNIAGRFIFTVMPTIIAAIVGTEEVTMFSLAMALEGYVFSFAEAINGMFLPRISRILAGRDTDSDISSLLRKVGRFHVATIGLIYIGFLCVGKQFVELWMGKGYELVYVGALFMIFPSLIDIPQQVAKTTLLAKDIVKEQALIYLVMAITNLILAFLLLPAFGLTGGAVAICCAFLIRTVLFNVLYYKRLNIDLRAYFVKTYCKWFVVSALTFVFGVFISGIKIYGWVALAIKSVLITCIYVVLYLLIELSKEEREMIGRRFRRLCR